MSLFDKLFRGKKATPVNDNMDTNKDEIMKMIFSQMMQKSPSDYFASGAVFDITRQRHEAFEQIIRSGNALALLKFFSEAYVLFCDNPSVVGFTANMVNLANNDTDTRNWNADIFKLESNDFAALCFIPIQNDTIAARVVGIILSDRGDGYYYCMLNKDENTYSDVIRNKAMAGVENIGKVKGLGFELMDSFLNCIKENFYQS